MKMLAVGATLVLCLGLCACAGTTNRNGYVRQQMLDDNIDYGKVIAVNQWAERKGALVVWVNYPTRPVRNKPTGG